MTFSSFLLVRSLFLLFLFKNLTQTNFLIYGIVLRIVISGCILNFKRGAKGCLWPFAEITTIIYYFFSVSVVSFFSTVFSSEFSIILSLEISSLGAGFPSSAADTAAA